MRAVCCSHQAHESEGAFGSWGRSPLVFISLNCCMECRVYNPEHARNRFPFQLKWNVHALVEREWIGMSPSALGCADRGLNDVTRLTWCFLWLIALDAFKCIWKFSNALSYPPAVFDPSQLVRESVLVSYPWLLPSLVGLIGMTSNGPLSGDIWWQFYSRYDIILYLHLWMRAVAQVTSIINYSKTDKSNTYLSTIHYSGYFLFTYFLIKTGHNFWKKINVRTNYNGCLVFLHNII